MFPIILSVASLTVCEHESLPVCLLIPRTGALLPRLECWRETAISAGWRQCHFFLGVGVLLTEQLA